MTVLDARPIHTVFLDRDGVLNRKAPEGHYVLQWNDFVLLPGVAAALHSLNQAALPIYVVTNQRGASLGLYSEADIHALHARLQSHLAPLGAHIDGFFYCPHNRDACSCRKPRPGLFEQAKALHPEIDFHTSAMVGDSLSDIQAGHALGMQTIFIDGDPATQKPGALHARALASHICASLPEAVAILLGQFPRQ